MEKTNKFKRELVSDQVFNYLKEKIISGEYKVGEKIPSENELSESLGISRSSIKVAIERLKSIGLIKVVLGDGTYVTEFDVESYIQNFAEMIIDPKDINEIIELRRAIELQSMYYMIKRADEKDIKELTAIADKLDKAIKKKDQTKLVKYDYEFHLQICKASKNKYFEMMFKLIGKMTFKQIEQFVGVISWDGFINGDDHMLILKAIIDKDYEEASSVLLRMTDYETHKSRLSKE